MVEPSHPSPPVDDLERQLASAQRTIDVLKRQVRKLYDEGTQTGLSRQLQRAQERQRELEQRRLLTEVREQELKRYNQTLEADVRARTAALRAIHDHLTSGFLLIDRSLRVQPGFTRCCHDLMGTDDIEGAALVELLRIDDDRDRSALQMALEQIFEDLLPEEAAIGQLPSRYQVEGRVLRLDFGPVRSESGVLESLLVTVIDATAEEASARQNRANQVLIGLLLRREAFSSFVADARAQLAAARDGLDTNGGCPNTDAAFVSRVVHTVKGNAASFGLDEVVAVAHDAEEGGVTGDGLDQLTTAIRDFLDANHDVLNVSFDADPTASYPVDRSRAIELQELVTDCAANSDHLRRWAAELTLKPVADVLGPVGQFATELGNRLGKQIEVELIGADVAVDAEHLQPVLSTLAHSLRNAVDHGIELPDDRGLKPTTATIRIMIIDEETAWRIVVADDGRGIDVDKVARRAVADGYLDEGHLDAMDRRQRLQLVFTEGLSTATRATELSGRGSGMGALKAAAEAVGGTVSVDSVDGEGTTLDLHLPKPSRLLPTGEGARLPTGESARLGADVAGLGSHDLVVGRLLE
jgi:two-component system chemotaxis sensor kinase CheA